MLWSAESPMGRGGGGARWDAVRLCQSMVTPNEHADFLFFVELFFSAKEWIFWFLSE